MGDMLQVLAFFGVLVIAGVVLLFLNERAPRGYRAVKPAYAPRHSSRAEPPMSNAERLAEVPNPPAGEGGGSKRRGE